MISSKELATYMWEMALHGAVDFLISLGVILFLVSVGAMSYLSSVKDKVHNLFVILIVFSTIFAGCAKRDVISGFPEKEAVKWRPGAGTVIAVGSVALLSVAAYIDSKSLFKRPAAVAEWCFCPQCTLLRRQGVQEAFRVYLLSEDGEAFDFRE